MFGDLILGVVFSGLVMFGLCAAVDQFDAAQCRAYQTNTGVETKRDWFGDCYLNTSEGWMPWVEYKARITAKGLNKAGGVQ